MNILFIHSRDFWDNGWLVNRDLVKAAKQALVEGGIQVEEREVVSVSELESLLDEVPSSTLIWPNAYYVANDQGTPVWIPGIIEQKGLPYLGNDAASLEAMLHKGDTYARMAPYGAPVPKYLVWESGTPSPFASDWETSGLSFPISMKPSSESSSSGVKRVLNQSEAEAHAAELFHKYPQSDVMLEEFLPSEDIACGYFQLGDEILMLPTFYASKEVSGKEHMVERDLGVGPWGGEAIIMPPIQDEDILSQLTETMPKVVASLCIRGVTRADGRLDDQGVLRYFDVNGMPEMSYPKSVIV
ncbi:MAG: hypothetical protein AAFQ98_26945, partial [Bacteroidota bacterium]